MASTGKTKKQKKKTKKQDPIAKQILDKYATTIIRKNAIYTTKEGDSGVDRNKDEIYAPKKYAKDIVLWIPPKNWIRLEFEGTPKENKRWVTEIESSCQALDIEYCISEHKGGKSQYINICNIAGIPVNYDNKKAKNSLIDTIIPPGASKQMDKTNLGWTLSPVIGHPHWKKKYNGTIHQIIRGISPLDQKNKYDPKLLKSIDRGKKYTKSTTTEILQKNQWVNDFLIEYCTSHLLPKGARHHTIEKNLAILIYHRKDGEEIKNRYLKAQERTANTLRTWTNAISRGQYPDVSPLELKKYIEENNIDYVILKHEKADEKLDAVVPLDATAIQLLKDPKLLLNLVEEIHKQGVIGEDGSILAIINKTNLRLVKNHNPTSSNMVLSDIPGAGKDVLTKIVTRVIIPKDKLIHRTRFSDKALEYFMTNKKEGYTLDGSVIYLEDPEEDLLKSQAFRVMASGQNKVTVVKDQALLELEVKGKPVILVTSMNATIDEEGGRRWDGIKIDTSEILTKKVIEDKLRKTSEGIDWKYKPPPLVKAIQGLEPHEVIIPYAIELLPYFEKDPSLIMRTQVGKLIDYIKSSAVMHQHQRKKDSKGRLIADDFDYEYGKFMFQILGDAEGGILNPIERDLIETLKKSGDALSFAEISAMGFKRTVQWLYKHLEELKAKGIVKEKYEFDDKANKNITKLYSTFGYSSINLPTALVLNGFNGAFENQQRGGFNGFNGFINILKELNEKRNVLGLSKISFEDLDEKKIQSLIKSFKTIKTIKTKDMAVLKSGVKTIKNLSQSDRINELREWCDKVKGDGYKVTYGNLIFNFDKPFIEKCKEKNILISLPDGNYDFGG